MKFPYLPGYFRRFEPELRRSRKKILHSVESPPELPFPRKQPCIEYGCADKGEKGSS